MSQYEVKFLVRGMVSVYVDAKSPEEATAKARERWDKESFFRKKREGGIEVLDEKSEPAGVENLDLWAKLND